MRARGVAAALALTAVALASFSAPADDILATDVAGVPAANVGMNGPLADHLINLELVGHTGIPIETVDFEGNPAILPIGNNGAPALMGDCAYVGRWHDYFANTFGIQVVDIADPTSPSRVGSITDGIPSGAVPREIRTIDVGGFRVLVVLLFAQFIDSGAANPGRNSLLLYTVDETDCTDVSYAGQIDTLAVRGHEFFLWLDPNPAHDVDGHPRALVLETTPIGPPNIVVYDISDPASPRILTTWEPGYASPSFREAITSVAGNRVPGGPGTYAHSISLSPDGREAYLSYWDGGFFTMDTSDLADAEPVPVIKPKGAMSVPYVYPPLEVGNTHSAVRAGDRDLVVVGDEVYVSTDGCPFGWLRTIDIGDEQTPPAQVGEFRLAENRSDRCAANGLSASLNAAGMPIDGTFSMHNQTVTRDFVYTSWYGGGLRVIDITDPAAPVEAGAFVPAPLASETATFPATSAPTYGKTTLTQDDDWLVAMWSYPVIRDGLIYVTDVRNGLYILRPTVDAPFAADVIAAGSLEGNSNTGLFD